MAQDLFFKNSNRNWARRSTVSGVGEETPPPATKLGKIVMGSMAAATGLGLLFITSPWWHSQPVPARRTNNRLGPHTYHFARTPSGRVVARPI
jgi:hypothetical protein